jgi:hypothetical protein
MSILPSTMGYSIGELDHKLTLVQDNFELFLDHARQTVFSLHVDVVLPQFAKKRGVRHSPRLNEIFQELHRYFENIPLYATVHLMGELEDIVGAYAFFKNYTFLPHWKYLFLVSPQFYDSWLKLMTLENITIGVWLDLDQWPDFRFAPNNSYLLMTVVAGRSYQKASPKDKDKALRIAQGMPASYFIVDGGWHKDECKDWKNLDVVMDGGFWPDFQQATRFL